MQVVPDGRRCECGNRGCWEQYASGNVLVREARELAAATRRWRTADAGARRRRRVGDHRAAGHGRGAGRRPGRARAVRGGRALARRRHRQPRGGVRPRDVRHRRRRLGGRRPAHRPGPRGVQPQPDRPPVPAGGEDRAGRSWATRPGWSARPTWPGRSRGGSAGPGPGRGTGGPATPAPGGPCDGGRQPADVQRRRRLAGHGLPGQPDDGHGRAAAGPAGRPRRGFVDVLARRLVERYPKFRLRPLPSGSPFEQPVWADDPEFTLDRHLVDAGQVADDDGLARGGEPAAQHPVGHAPLALAVPRRVGAGDRRRAGRLGAGGPAAPLHRRRHRAGQRAAVADRRRRGRWTRPCADRAGARPAPAGDPDPADRRLPRPGAGGRCRPAGAAVAAAGARRGRVRLAGAEHRCRPAAGDPRPAHPAGRPAGHRQGGRLVPAAGPRGRQAGGGGSRRDRQRRAARRHGRRPASAPGGARRGAARPARLRAGRPPPAGRAGAGRRWATGSASCS